MCTVCECFVTSRLVIKVQLRQDDVYHSTIPLLILVSPVRLLFLLLICSEGCSYAKLSFNVIRLSFAVSLCWCRKVLKALRTFNPHPNDINWDRTN